MHQPHPQIDEINKSPSFPSSTTNPNNFNNPLSFPKHPSFSEQAPHAHPYFGLRVTGLLERVKRINEDGTSFLRHTCGSMNTYLVQLFNLENNDDDITTTNKRALQKQSNRKKSFRVGFPSSWIIVFGVLWVVSMMPEVVDAFNCTTSTNPPVCDPLPNGNGCPYDRYNGCTRAGSLGGVVDGEYDA